MAIRVSQIPLPAGDLRTSLPAWVSSSIRTAPGRRRCGIGAGLFYDSVGSFIPVPAWSHRIHLSALRLQTRAGPYQFDNPWGNVPGGNPFPLPTPGKNIAFPLANAEVGFAAAHSSAERGAMECEYTAPVRPPTGSFPFLTWATRHPIYGLAMTSTQPFTFLALAVYAACSTTGNTQARRVLTLANPRPGNIMSQVTIADDGVNANYNGLLTSIEHRFAHNYTLLANTPGRNASVSPRLLLWATRVSRKTRTTFRADYGPCTYDVPFLFNASVVYMSQ